MINKKAIKIFVTGILYVSTVFFTTGQSKDLIIDKFLTSGEIKEKTGDYKGAINDFSKVIETDSINETAYLHRGLCYFIINQPDIAYKDLTKAIQLNPYDFDAFHGRANVLISQRKIREALFDFQNAIDINPQFADAYYNRGYLYLQLDSVDLAFKDINKALSLDSDDNVDVDAYYTRGLLWEEKQDLKKAIEDFNVVIRNNEKYFDAYFERGVCKKDLEMYEAAIADFNYLLTNDYFNTIEVYKHIAHCYYKLNDTSQCCKYLGFLFGLKYNNSDLMDYYKQYCH